MSITQKLEKLCTKLGENNKAEYAVVTIATVKGIFRPLFTMMDKKEKPETKKYTALREGMTEIIAIPAYLACGALAAKLGKMSIPDISKMPKEKVDKLPGFIKDVDYKTLVKRASSNFRFMGVCIAAIFVIPGLSSVAIRPFMDLILGKPKSKPAAGTSQNPPVFKAEEAPEVKQVFTSHTQTISPKLNPYASFRPVSGMKVGGV